MEEREPWERQDGEPMLWFNRFERYRLLGPDRSLLAAYNEWRSEKDREGRTAAPPTWRRARDDWNWQERAEAWDQHLLSLVAQREEDARIEALATGFALQYERIRALGELADLLFEEVLTEDKRWLPDVKAIGSSLEGTFERVDLVRFNAALVKELRGALGDIAEEMGERVKGLEISGKGGKPLLPVAELVSALQAADKTLDENDAG